MIITEDKGVIIMEGTILKDIKIGSKVKIAEKQNQKNGILSEGIVKDILTNSSSHPHGIKVRLENGLVGRVKVIVNE
jgi:uncharacterized repeat protein (TIGR03833 family)